MAIYLLDTDMLSHAQRDHPQVKNRIAAHVMDKVCISVVTIEEQIGGWAKLQKKAATPIQLELASSFLAALVSSWNQLDSFP